MQGDPINWLEAEIEECRHRLEMLQSLLSMLREKTPDRVKPRAGERVEEIRKRRRVVALLFESDDRIRLVPRVPVKLFPEARDYLYDVLREIAVSRGDGSRPQAYFDLDETGTLAEAVVEGLSNVMERLRVKAALKHLFDISWDYTQKLRG